jgi:hypothetical protein
MEPTGAIAGATLGMFFVVHVIGAIIVGAFTTGKKMGFGEAFALSLFFTPVIAIICVYLNENK